MRQALREAVERLKKTVDNRPLGCGCLLFMLSTALVLFSPLLFKIIAAGVCLFSAFLLLIVRRRGAHRTALLRSAVCLLIAFLSILASFIGYDLFDRRLQIAAESRRTAEVTLYLDEVVYETDFKALYKARVEELDGARTYETKTLIAFEEERPGLYVRLMGIGSFSPPESTSPGFDARSFYRAEGIFSQITNGDDLTLTDSEVYLPGRFLSLWRDAVKERISSFTNGNAAALIKTLLTGDKSDLPDSVKRDFGALGVSHLLAVSGLHLSVLFALAEFLLLRLRVGMKPRSLILLIFVLGFMALCSFSPSVTRAGIMLILYLLARLFSQTPDGLTSLFFAGALIVLVSPYSVFNVSFLLSFCATFGILAFNRLPAGRSGSGEPSFPARVGRALGVSFAAQIAVLPVCAWAYGSVSVLSPLFTLIFALPITLILYLAPLCLLLSFIPGVSQAASALITLPCNLTVKLSSFARHFRGFNVSLDGRILPVFLVLIGVLVLFILLGRRKKLWASLTLCSYLLLGLLCFCLPLFQSPHIIKSTYKKNDLLLINGRGETAAVDLSDGSKISTEHLLALMRSETSDLYPDVLILTHYHQKHFSSLKMLLERSYLEKLMLPTPGTGEDERDLALSLKELAESYGVKTAFYDGEVEETFCGGITFESYGRVSLSRSTHPVFAFTLRKENESVRFLSSSAWEKLPVGDCETVVFLKHGPVVKKPPDVFLRQDLRAYCPEELEAALDVEGIVPLRDGEPFILGFT